MSLGRSTKDGKRDSMGDVNYGFLFNSPYRDIEDSQKEKLKDCFDLWSLNRSERRALVWIIDVLDWDIDLISRNGKGLDFCYNNSIGVEIKSESSYSITRNQLIDFMNNYNPAIVIVSNNDGVYIKDVIRHGYVCKPDRDDLEEKGDLVAEMVMEIIGGVDNA